eukprot:Skav235465  [mRNA]  locus=scaffold1451:87309:88999:+ [translate_table: standard]
MLIANNVFDDVLFAGILLDYSFSKGHLTYLAGSAAMQNTLLLHDDSDSITFFFEPGTYTNSVHLKLEHQQLDDPRSAVLFVHDKEIGEAKVSDEQTLAREYQLDLPAGPSSDSIESHLVHYAKECQCGEEKARGLWLGTECLREQQLDLNRSGKDSMCLFVKKSFDQLNVVKSNGRLSGRDIVQWLQNVTISGKFARLVTEFALDESSQMRERAALKPKIGSDSQISSVFEKLMPLDFLMEVSQLLIATTQDETDYMTEVWPLRIVLHPPPIQVFANLGFLLPEFAIEKKRTQYFACNMANLTVVTAHISDQRFQVKDRLVPLPPDCFDYPVEQKRFWAVRSDSKFYYRRWSDYNYDVEVTFSPEACLHEAIAMDMTDVIQRIAHVIPSEIRQKHSSCAILQRAIREEQQSGTGHEMLPELLKFWDPNCPGCRETPLGVAATEAQNADSFTGKPHGKAITWD